VVPAEQRQALLQLARQALRDYLETGVVLEPADPSGLPDTVGGLFVTLRQQGQLRGCIGVLGTGEPPERDVVRCSISAATEDPRFPAVTLADLPQLKLEISILSTLHPVAAPQEILVGRDGLQIEKEGRRGLLLPQVPVEQGWDRVQFLQELCQKAGLPRDAWKTSAILHRFTAQVFHE